MAVRYGWMVDTDNDIIFREEGRLGRITLNRPKALNALTLSMCERMHRQLDVWAGTSDILAVAIDGGSGRAFCAGGDMRAVWEWGRANDPRALEFFATEYRLNGAVKHFPKPYVAFLDGIVMGGGAGISVHGSHRVATENTLFAMPETAIGFFPDVGGSFFLSRCPGALGPYLGLTGARIDAADMLHADLATHFAPSARIPDILQRLANGEAVNAVLSASENFPGASMLAQKRAAIDRTFSEASVEAIAQALGGEGEWGRDVAAMLFRRSPTSLKLVCRQLQEGRARALDACLRMEYGLAAQVLRGRDFYEGVRAVLIDKDQSPQWKPAALADVSPAAIAAYFAPSEIL